MEKDRKSQIVPAHTYFEMYMTRLGKTAFALSILGVILSIFAVSSFWMSGLLWFFVWFIYGSMIIISLGAILTVDGLYDSIVSGGEGSTEFAMAIYDAAPIICGITIALAAVAVIALMLDARNRYKYKPLVAVAVIIGIVAIVLAILSSVKLVTA